MLSWFFSSKAYQKISRREKFLLQDTWLNMRSDEKYCTVIHNVTDDKTRKYNFKLWIFMFGIFLLLLSPYLNNQCNVKMSLNNSWCVITVLIVKLFKFETLKVEKNEKVCTWAHLRLFYHVMTVDRCAGLPDLVTSHSTARLSEVVQGRRPHVPRPLLDLPHHFPSLPSGSGSALGTAITLPASQIFVLWAINLYGCKDYSPTSDNNCLGSPLQNYFLVHFFNKKSSTVLKIESKLLSFTAIILVTTCYWNVVTNNWVSPVVRVLIRLVRNPRITANYDSIIASELNWGYVKKLQGVFLSLTIKPYEQFLSCCTRIKTKVCLLLKTQCSWYKVEYFNLNLKTKPQYVANKTKHYHPSPPIHKHTQKHMHGLGL